jgi:hypothetical protein
MKIVNKTLWQTAHIKAIIYRVAYDEQVSLKDALFTIKYRRQSKNWKFNYAGGYALYGMPPRVTLSLPEPQFGCDHAELAHVIAHELAHSQNCKHRGMKKTSIYDWAGCWKEHFAWAHEMPLEKQEPIRKPIPTKTAVILKKLDHANAKMIEWNARVKKAQSAYKRWVRRRKYYDGQFAKAAVSAHPLEILNS